MEFDGVTREERNALDREYWVTKLCTMAAIDLATSGSLQRSTMEGVLSLTAEERSYALSEEGRARYLSMNPVLVNAKAILNGESTDTISAGVIDGE